MKSNNKRIGILTLSSSDNCGSLLQAYALYCFLCNELHFDASVINFNSYESKRLYSIRFSRRNLLNPKLCFPTLGKILLWKRQKRDYQIFRKKVLNIRGREYRTMDDLKKNASFFTHIIVGSDQVWNVSIKDFNNAFFLTWSNKARKIAYAASLGNCLLTSKYSFEELSQIFTSFNSISVREDSGLDQIGQLTDKRVQKLLDPTLILPKHYWDEIAGERLIKRKYIFFYSWSYCDDKINKLVQKYAKTNGLDVIVINSFKWKKHSPNEYGFKMFKRSGPAIFLNLMKYSEKVFVQSFHGIIFASVFSKDFFFLDEHNDNILDPRISSILEIVGQQHRVARSYDDLLNYRNESTDAFFANPDFIERKKQSIAFLEEALSK